MVMLKFSTFQVQELIEDINQYTTLIIKKEPDYLILHVGTNDGTTNTSKTIIDDLVLLKSNILKC